MSEKRFTFYYERGNEVVIEDNGKRLSNKKVVDLLNEQQATIRKLQDLCGQSDGENAKLRIENKQLQEEIKLLKPTNREQYEQIVQLQKENEQLKFENKKLQCINDQIEERLENSGIGIALKMDCDMNE